MIRELKQKFNKSKYGEANDQYIQRFLPAAGLSGANPKNAYTPIEPYTVEMQASVNKHTDAPLTGGEVMYIYVITSGGWSQPKRAVDVFRSYNTNSNFKVFSCPSLYYQCQTIVGQWKGLK